MADDYGEIEEKAKALLSKRKTRYNLKLETDALRDEIIAWMDEHGKNRILIDDISIELTRRKKDKVDFGLLRDLIDNHIIPEETLKNSEIRVLEIASSKDIKLEGNKFIRT